MLFFLAISKECYTALREGSAAKDVPVIKIKSKFWIWADSISWWLRKRSAALCLYIIDWWSLIVDSTMAKDILASFLSN